MKKPWSNLPNAPHIDWVIASLKDNPDLWTAAEEAARAAWDAAWSAARYAAWAAVRGAAREAAWNAARSAAGVVAWNAARDAAEDSILALVAYDDCAEYLNMSHEELRIWAALSEHPAAVLLQPMVYVKNHSERSFC